MYDIFSMKEAVFPEGFLWGSATAGHQVEGNNRYSQHWKWEQEGKYPEKSGLACNHYELYKEDVELLKSLGHQAYRFSVEWSRIEPHEGEFNEEAVEHYVDLCRRLKENSIKTFVTLHHFTHPMWFEAKGGFARLENLGFFERYVNYIAARISQYVDSWNVINEFNLGYGPEKELYKLNMIRYHARGYHTIKQYSKAPVSTAHAFVHWFPYRRHDDLDNRMTEYVDFVTNEFFFHAIRTGEIVYPFHDAVFDPEVRDTMDYWGVNYYTRHMVDARKAGAEGKRFDHKVLKMIPQDFYLEEMFPEGLTANLERLKDKPVYITENGVSCKDDRFRIVYLALHLSAMKEAIDRGVDLRGYLYWSLMDNYEWGSFTPRFGLLECDFKTFKRTPKPSAEFYRDIITHNGLNPEMIRKYLSFLPTL